MYVHLHVHVFSCVRVCVHVCMVCVLGTWLIPACFSSFILCCLPLSLNTKDVSFHIFYHGHKILPHFSM